MTSIRFSKSCATSAIESFSVSPPIAEPPGPSYAVNIQLCPVEFVALIMYPYTIPLVSGLKLHTALRWCLKMLLPGWIVHADTVEGLKIVTP